MYCLKAVQISDEPNEPRHEIPRDERGPPFVFVTPEPGNEYQIASGLLLTRQLLNGL